MATNYPTQEASNFDALFDAWLNNSGALSDLGIKSQVVYANGAKTLRELLSGQNLSKDTIKALEKSGIDLDKAYGKDSEQLRTIQDRIYYIKKYEGAKGYEEKFSRSITNLTNDVNVFGETAKRYEYSPASPGEGYNKLQSMDKLRAFLQKNPDADLSKLTQKQLASITGRDYNAILGDKGEGKDALSKLIKSDLKDIQSLAESEDFTTYQRYQDISGQMLESQQQNLQAFIDAQKRVNAPGYAQGAANSAFAPMEEQLRQYYDPVGGAKISQFGLEVGEKESAMGRAGDVRVQAEAQRQEALARERVAAQKSAYAGQLQQQIDFGNPMEALRMSSALAPQAAAYAAQPSMSQLNPLSAIFPMSSQQFSMQLQPYSLGQPMQQGPEWYDFMLGGISAAGPLLGGAGQLAAGVQGKGF